MMRVNKLSIICDDISQPAAAMSGARCSWISVWLPRAHFQFLAHWAHSRTREANSSLARLRINENIGRKFEEETLVQLRCRIHRLCALITAICSAPGVLITPSSLSLSLSLAYFSSSGSGGAGNFCALLSYLATWRAERIKLVKREMYI